MLVEWLAMRVYMREMPVLLVLVFPTLKPGKLLELNMLIIINTANLPDDIDAIN
jgi:hypothetical protein